MMGFTDVEESFNHCGLAFYSSGSETGPIVVLGHALGATHHIWAEVIAELGPSYRVITWDLPGHGKSDPIGADTSMETIVTRLQRGLAQMGVERFHLGGISLGGMVALAFGEAHPDQVQTLGICDSGPALLPAEPWLTKAALVRDQGTEALVEATMQRWFTPSFQKSKAAQQVRERFIACSSEGYAQCCEVIANTNLSSGLAQVQVPTLLLTGEEDEGMNPADLAQLATKIPGARNASVQISGAKHLTCVEQPSAVAGALRAVIHSL